MRPYSGAEKEQVFRSVSARFHTRTNLSRAVLLLLLVVSIFGGSDLLERELFIRSPEALSHIFFLDSLNTDFHPLSSQRVGYAFYQSNWMEYAAFKFEQALFQSQSPDERDWVSIWFGLSYLKYGNISDMYEEVASFNTPWANLWRGLALFEMDELDSARTTLQRVIDTEGVQKATRLEAKYILGLSYVDNDPQAAENIFDELLEEYPKSILRGELLFRLATIELNSDSLFNAMERLSEAEVYYLGSSRKEAHWWAEDMYLLLGALNYRMGRYSIARKRLTELIDEFPETEYEDRARHLMLLSGLREWGISDSTFRIPPDMDQRLKWDLLFNLAWEYFTNKSYQEAAEIFVVTLKYVEEDSDKYQSHYYLAESYYNLGNYEYAEQYFALAAKGFLERDANWGRGWSLSRQKKYAEARDAFESVASLDDTLGIRAIYQAAMTYYNARQYSKAIDGLEDFSRKHRGWLLDDAQYFIVKALEKMDNPERLAERTEKFVRDFPYTKLNDEFLVISLKRLMDVDMLDNAVNLGDILLERELPMARADSIFHYSQVARYSRGDFTDVQVYLEQYSRDNHLFPIIVEGIADSLWQFANVDKSILIWEMLRAPDVPDSVFAYATFRQAEGFLELGDISGAGRNIDQIVGELPNSSYGPTGLLMIASWYIEESDFEMAIETIERTRELYPDTDYDCRAILLLGKVYDQIEKYPESRAVLTAMPQDSLCEGYRQQAQIDIMQSFINEGTYSRAIDFYNQSSDSLSPESQCLFDGQLGHAHSLLGNVTTADSIFTAISESQEKCGHQIPGYIYYVWGDLMERAREYDKACSLLTITIKQESSDSIVRKASEKLFEIENELKGGKK